MRGLVLLFVILAAVASAAKAEQVCEPLSTFNEFCNSCKCSADGTAKACTLMVCPPIYHPDGTLKLPHEVLGNPLLRGPPASTDGAQASLERAKRQSQNTCEPLSTFNIDCNTCMCSSDGATMACTQMACLNIPEKLPHEILGNPLLRGSPTDQ